MKEKNKYWQLFSSSLYLSSFTFGGGYVIIPLLKKKFVDDLNWIDEEEMMDLTAIAQSSPGSVAINASILVGYKVAGFGGALMTVLGTVLPPLLILSVVSYFYNEFKTNTIIALMLRGMQAGIAAVIFDVVLTMLQALFKQKQALPIMILMCSFIATYFFKINILYIVLVAGAIGVANISHNKNGGTK